MSDTKTARKEQHTAARALSTQYLDTPVSTSWRSTDSVDRLHSILTEHERGVFGRSALLVEEMLTDDRISGCLNTRIGGLLSAPLSFQPASSKKKSRKLAQLLGGSDETEDDGAWPLIVSRDVAYDLLKWKIMLGVAVAQIVWTMHDDVMYPRLISWHPRTLWWNWSMRCYQVATAGPDPGAKQPENSTGRYIVDLPRTDRVTSHGGQWFVWGGQYSWMHGLVRSLGMKFVDRTWNERDWSRYCEKHGLAIVEGMMPSGTVTEEKREFMTMLANLGNEPTIITPQAPAGEPGYGFKLHEATSRSWETYQARKRELDTDIAVTILGQNLTTEVRSGSLAAAAVHESVRLDKKREDAELFSQIREQVLVPWAEYNWGSGAFRDNATGREIAPYPRAQIDPPEDEQSEANALKLLGEACRALREVDPDVDTRAILAAHGVPFDELEQTGDEDAARGAPLNLTPTAQSSIVTVNEVRASLGLPPWPDEDGNLTVIEFQMKRGGVPQPVQQQRASDNMTALKALLSRSAAGAGSVGSAADRRVKRYQDAVIARAQKRAAEVLAPVLDAILADIDRAGSLDEVKGIVLEHARAQGKTVEQIAALLERVNLLAHMQGRESLVSKRW